MGESLLPPLELTKLAESWEIILTSENKSPATRKSYMRGIDLYIRWCGANGHPLQLTRPLVQAYIAGLVGAGQEPATVRLRLAALRQFAKWLVDEGEIPADPLEGLRPPKLEVKVVHGLSDEQLQAMLKTCKGATFRDKRDEALIRLLAETGLRASECTALTVSDIDLKRGLAHIRRGKGAKGRVVPFSAQAAAAIDRYLRIRRSHKLAGTATLWLGHRGPLGYPGLHETLIDRARRAGIERFHLHMFRHTAATRWLRAGGSEGGLMAVAGWSDRSMLDRYTQATAAERAADEARGLNLGEL